LDEETIELNAEKETLTYKVKEKDDAINEHNTKVQNLETEIKNRQSQIENNYAELQKQLQAIFNDFSARITSGRIFTDVILDSVMSAYKSGFIEFLPEYYSQDEVTNRVREIEQATATII